MSALCLRRHPMVGTNVVDVLSRLSVNGWQSLSLFANKYHNNSNDNYIERQTKQSFDRKVTSNTNQWKKRVKEEKIRFDPRFSDTFGTLGGNHMSYKRLSAEDLPEDEDNYDRLDIKRGPKMAEIGYIKLLNQYINQKPIQMKKALELYNKMISEDRIPPHKIRYTLLITGCARVGFTERAFELFEEMLKFELKPTKPAITALFNACAESPFNEFGLEKARYLRDWMACEGVVANTLHYHSMIKAFGKLGDMETAYQLVDEMVANGQTTTDETFAMLLIGCISNKELGLFEAIKLVNRMTFHRIPLTIYSFNLLLRAVRDCGIGSEDNLKLLIESCNYPSEDSSKQTKNNRQRKAAKAAKKMKFSLTVNNSEDKSLIVRIPNMLMENVVKPNHIIKIDYKALSTSYNRFMLLGGIERFVNLMTKFNVNPNLNTLTLMTELIDFKEESENVILVLIDRFNLKVDTDFYNILMKHICVRRGMIDAKRIIGIMSQKGFLPNIMTFGVLSLGCNDINLAKQLLNDMQELNIKPNIQIIGGLIANACKSNNFLYINFLMNYMKDNDIKADQKIIESLEVMKLKFQKLLADYDWNNTDIEQRFKSQRFRDEFTIFNDNYQNWLQNMTIEDTPHPWNQFQIQELPNKSQMHTFVKYMKTKIQKRRQTGDELDIDEYEEDELYDD